MCNPGSPSTCGFDWLPTEMMVHIFRRVGCEERSLGNVSQQFRGVSRDPMCCTCQFKDLIPEVLLNGNRNALMHLVRSHIHELDPVSMGELSLACGTLSTPESRLGTPSRAVAGNMLAFACIEGRATLVRELLNTGVTPTMATVMLACERLHVHEDSGPLDALISWVPSGAAETALLDSFESVPDSEDGSEEPVAANCVHEILSSACFSYALLEKGYSKAFKYLLRWDHRFSSSRRNYLLALECAVAAEDRLTANDLFRSCGMEYAWISSSHIALLAERGWHELLSKALKCSPEHAVDALTRSVISRKSECVNVALKRIDQVSRQEARDWARLAIRVGTDDVFQELVQDDRVFIHCGVDTILLVTWRRKWMNAFRYALGKSRHADTNTFLQQNADGLIGWAIAHNKPELVAPVVERADILLSRETVYMLSRHVRTWRNTQDVYRSRVAAALKARPELFNTITNN